VTMETKDIKWCPQHGYPLPCYKCGLPLSSTDQKEIYKAGQKNVMGWVEKENPSYPYSETLVIKLHKWEAKKKEVSE